MGVSSDGVYLDQAIGQVVKVLGQDGLVDTAATIAIFDAVVRVADATGIPLEPVKEENSRDFRDELGINDYRNR